MARLDETTLRRLYEEEQLSIRAIADRVGLSHRTIYDALIRWHIPRRPQSARTNRPAPLFPFDEATMRYLYLDAEFTIKEIASQLKVPHSAVWTALKHWQIPRRRCGPRRIKQP